MAKRSRGGKKISAQTRALKELRDFLRELQNNPRLQLLSPLALEHMLAKRATEFVKVRGLTVGELASMADVELSPLRALSASKLTYLLSILTPLVEPNADGTFFLFPAHPEKKKDDVTTHIGSIEAERRLQDLVKKLKSSPKFSTLKTQTLGEFWDSTWPRAPFEESMTFGQFSSLRMDEILKKRSFGTEKIFAVLGALHRALEDASASEAKNSESAPKKHSNVSSNTSTPSHAYSSILPVVAAMRMEASKIRLQTGAARILSILCNEFTDIELSLLWLHVMSSSAHGETLDQNFTKIAHAILGDSAQYDFNSIRARAHNRLQQNAPEILRYWANIGESKSQRYEPYIDSSLELVPQLAALDIAAHAAGIG